MKMVLLSFNLTIRTAIVIKMDFTIPQFFIVQVRTLCSLVSQFFDAGNFFSFPL
jgi:hypothetical protein